MSRVVKSNIDGFVGQVTFFEPLTIDQVFAIEDAQDQAAEIEPSTFWKKVNQAKGEDAEALQTAWSSRSDKFFIGAILKCTESFRLEGFSETPTPENFPMTPRGKARDFVQLLWDELQNIYWGEKKIPNES